MADEMMTVYKVTDGNPDGNYVVCENQEEVRETVMDLMDFILTDKLDESYLAEFAEIKVEVIQIRRSEYEAMEEADWY